MIRLLNHLKHNTLRCTTKSSLGSIRTFYQSSKLSDSVKAGIKESVIKEPLAKTINIRPSTTDIDSHTKLTTLKNGLRIVSDSTPGHFSAFGVYVDAGSRYESKNNSGISHFIDRISFKSTKNSSADNIQSQLESLGGNIMSHSSREVMLLQGTVYNQDLEKIVPLFADIIQNPALVPHELDEQRIAIGYEVGDIMSNPETYLPELLHTAAYHDNTLGKALLCTPDRVGAISSQMINDYRQALYTPERIVIASMGQSHEKVVELVEKNFETLSNQSQSTTPSSFIPDTSVSKYTGGALFNPDPTAEFTQVYVAVEGVGINDPDLYPLATLQMLLGGGGSFSAGGPGKGMHSRLYRTVLNQYAWAHSFLAFNHSYKDSGLFGISAACPPRFNTDMLHVLAHSLASVAYPNQISPIELSRAKNQLKNNMMMSLESRLVGLEDLGQQILCANKRVSVQEVCRRVDQVQLEDITRVASKLLLSPETKITLVGQGYYDGIEKTSEIFRKFGIGNGEALTRWD